MRLAFSTLCAPKWDFETLAARAKEYGYDGIELRGFLNESVLTASNVFLSDPAKVRPKPGPLGWAIGLLTLSPPANGSTRNEVATALARWLTPVADYAASR